MSIVRRPLLPLLLLAALPACSSIYYGFMESFGVEKRHILVDRVEEARDGQEEAKEQFQTTLERFKELTGFDGGDLEDLYSRLNADYERCVDQADEVHERIGAIEDVAEDLAEEMKAEIEEISNPEYRRDSERIRADIQERSRSIVEAMRRAEAKMGPVLTAYKDEVLRLKHNLNAKAIESLAGQVPVIEDDVQRLITEMEASIAEANEFIAAMDQG